jgi:hypothetical protein
MDFTAFSKSLESTALASGIRDSLLWFPLLEALHVMALVLVFGSIVVVDLRALGLASRSRLFSRVAADTLRWTWLGFAAACITGGLMFSTNAQVYAANRYFQVKMLLLLLAGLNMLLFQFTAGRRVAQWDAAPSAPGIGKWAAAVSLALWLSIICMGRLIGFATTGAASHEPPPANNDFDDFLGGPPAQ